MLIMSVYFVQVEVKLFKQESLRWNALEAGSQLDAIKPASACQSQLIGCEFLVVELKVDL